MKAIERLPKGIADDIEKLNALRNGIAHAFFPENLKKASPEWKGKDVLTVDGIKVMAADMQKIFQYFSGDGIRTSEHIPGDDSA